MASSTLMPASRSGSVDRPRHDLVRDAVVLVLASATSVWIGFGWATPR
jgi:hypothetical protein